MAPVSTFYQQEVRKWLAQHPGRPVTIYQVSKLFGNAFLQAANMQTAVNGFKMTAETTGRAPQEASSLNPQVLNLLIQKHDSFSQTTPDKVVHPFDEPCCSKTLDPMPKSGQCQVSPEQPIFIVSPRDIIPPPHYDRNNTKRSDKREGKTAILTSSPYKRELEKKRKMGNQTRASLKNKKKAKVSTKRNIDQEDLSSEDGFQEDLGCIYCNDIYSNSKSNEGWIQCSGCLGWAHEECCGSEEEDDNFICDLCKPLQK
ncbi:hypothetical protein J6590_052247 [Homalodisca vitripennis]|nr:hypothetical protein J6590_052247 [Homalodisca vitripennis]